MKVFRWLVVVTVVAGAITGGVGLSYVLFAPTYRFASSTGATGTIPATQVPGMLPALIVFLTIEGVGLLSALVSGVLFSLTSQGGWRIALWVSALILLLSSAIGAFTFGSILFPAALLIFLAALLSLGIYTTTQESAEAAPSASLSSALGAPSDRARLISGMGVAFVGGIAIIFLVPVSWIALLLALAVSSIGATLLIRSPLSALVVPAGIWLGAMIALICNGVARGGFSDSTFWWGALEFAAILIVIAVIPSLIGVGIGALLARWIPGQRLS